MSTSCTARLHRGIPPDPVVLPNGPDTYIYGCVAVPDTSPSHSFRTHRPLPPRAWVGGARTASNLWWYKRGSPLHTGYQPFQLCVPVSEEWPTASDRVVSFPNASSATTLTHWSSLWLCRQMWSPGSERGGSRTGGRPRSPVATPWRRPSASSSWCWSEAVSFLPPSLSVCAPLWLYSGFVAFRTMPVWSGLRAATCIPSEKIRRSAMPVSMPTGLGDRLLG